LQQFAGEERYFALEEATYNEENSMKLMLTLEVAEVP
jgi:hypothetical protein